MIEKVFDCIYRVELALPRSLLKSFNCYVIKGNDRNLMIDAGLNFMGALQKTQADLNRISIDSNKTDFFITHGHADHIGLIGKLCGKHSRIFISSKDAEWIRASGYWERVRRFAELNGFPEGQLDKAIKHNPDFRYEPEKAGTFDLLEEGDTIRVGPYVLECIETPGHTAGHMCLYETENKLLFSGDHVTSDITTTVQLWSPAGNPLKAYFESLRKVDQLDVGIILPGHSSVFFSLKKRIKELFLYHQTRLDEITLILEKGRQNAYQIASLVKWNPVYARWDSLPPWQKLIATGQAISHLKYLEETKSVTKTISDSHLIEYSHLKGGFDLKENYKEILKCKP